MEQLQRLPLGVQDFSILRDGNYLYVDKTAIIYELTLTNRAVFLSRPRRFGKSLLLSTLKYYFLGRKDLFQGLALETLEKDWTAHPVLYFDLNGQDYTSHTGLEDVIVNHLAFWEELYSCKRIAQTPAVRFENVIKAAYEKTGKRVVVLVDEYDKPLLETMSVLQEIEEANRALFKGVFGVLKKMDAYLRFYMFTGVTKFSKVSIFSDLNQLNDISLDDEYAAICGITQTELETSFSLHIERLAEKQSLTRTVALSELKRMYDGYHFTQKMVDIYNPYSLINAFTKNDFGSYWFESGTPTFLINKLKESHFDVRKFTEETKLSESAIKDYRSENIDPRPFLYRNGFLTIKEWNRRQNAYRLCIPNDEVREYILNISQALET